MSLNVAQNTALRTVERNEALQTIRQYQSEIAEIREAPLPRRARLTMHALAVFVVGVGLIAVFGRTDRVISSLDGKIVPKEAPIVVQAFDEGVIRSIDVKPGQKVSKGQVLGTLDPTFSQALVDQYRAQVNSYTAEIARDEAEIQQKPLLFAPNNDPQILRYQKINSDLYNQQMANYRAQLANYDQQIALTKATISKFQNDQSRFGERSDVEHRIEGMYSTLESHGTGSLLNALTASDTRIDTTRNMEYDKNTVEENTHLLAQQQATREAYAQQFLTAASQDLATAKVNLDGAQAQLDAAAKRRELVHFTSPEDAQVMSIANVSVGSVLKPGDALFTLTPLNVPLEAEIKLSPMYVGFVRVGDEVQVKLDPFQFMEHGTVKGTVRWISEDITDPNNPLPTNNGQNPAGVAIAQSSLGTQTYGYYTARVSIGKLDLYGVPASFRLSPGMTLEADVKVGSHSIGAFLIGAAGRGTVEAMRSP